MTTVIPHSRVIPSQQEPLSLPSIVSRSLVSTTSISTYSIVETRISEHAIVLFTEHTYSSESVLMKLLHNYKDTRYSQETPKKRQQCQLEALRRNRAFSPEIYLGLARVEQYNLPKKTISIGEILTCPTMNELEPGADYVLIMHQLPEERSLVTLLEKENSVIIQQHMCLLTKHIAHMHKELLASPPREESTHWGQYEQLEEKLSQNLELLDLVHKTDKADLNDQDVGKNVAKLGDKLQSLFKQSIFRAAFEQRVQEQRIRLCHGDLKVPHIWIMPYDDAECFQAEPEHFIKILDAIDFNPLFCNIDILSDFAMLVTDIHTRTGSTELADGMIADYLLDTNQDEPEARLVLGYYLVEKALVGAAISILFDNLPKLGLRHLAIAKLRLQALVKMQAIYLSPILQAV